VSIVNEPHGAAAPEETYENELPVRRRKPGNVGQLPNTLDRQPLVPEDQTKVPTPGSNA
jgi:hypothetical protein